MADTISVSIEGLAEIEAELSRLSIELRGSVLKKAMRKAANRGKAEAGLAAPKGTGGGDPDLPELSKSVATKHIERDDVQIAIVGTIPEAQQAYLVEFGHRMVLGGTVPSGKPERTRTAADPEDTGKGRVVGEVAPHPWFRPAQEAAEPQIERILIDGLAKLVDKQLG